MPAGLHMQAAGYMHECMEVRGQPLVFLKTYRLILKSESLGTWSWAVRLVASKMRSTYAWIFNVGPEDLNPAL